MMRTHSTTQAGSAGTPPLVAGSAISAHPDNLRTAVEFVVGNLENHSLGAFDPRRVARDMHALAASSPGSIRNPRAAPEL